MNVFVIFCDVWSLLAWLAESREAQTVENVAPLANYSNCLFRSVRNSRFCERGKGFQWTSVAAEAGSSFVRSLRCPRGFSSLGWRPALIRGAMVGVVASRQFTSTRFIIVDALFLSFQTIRAHPESYRLMGEIP